MSAERFELPPVRAVTAYSWDKEYAATEADMRDHFALAAWFAGWDVAAEVKMPGGGRADLVIGLPNHPTFIVELKLSLRTPSEFRKGLQQVDGYRRMYAPTCEAGTLALLCGHVMETDATTSDMASRYSNLVLAPAWKLDRMLVQGFGQGSEAERAERREWRAATVEVLSAFANDAAQVPA